MKEKLKNTTGITLVALVITIIILLILATVTIRIVLSEGIIKRAENAVNQYNEVQNNELAQLDDAIAKMGQYERKTLDPDWYKIKEEEKEDFASGIVLEQGDLKIYILAASGYQSVQKARVLVEEYNNQVISISVMNAITGIFICYVADESIYNSLIDGDKLTKGTGWYITNVEGTLQNEKYTGACPISRNDFPENKKPKMSNDLQIEAEGVLSETYLQRVMDSF